MISSVCRTEQASIAVTGVADEEAILCGSSRRTDSLKSSRLDCMGKLRSFWKRDADLPQIDCWNAEAGGANQIHAKLICLYLRSG